MAGHVQLKFVMTECSETQIRLTGLNFDNFRLLVHEFDNGRVGCIILLNLQWRFEKWNFFVVNSNFFEFCKV